MSVELRLARLDRVYRPPVQPIRVEHSFNDYFTAFVPVIDKFLKESGFTWKYRLFSRHYFTAFVPVIDKFLKVSAFTWKYCLFSRREEVDLGGRNLMVSIRSTE